MTTFLFFELVFLIVIILDAMSQGLSHSGRLQNNITKRRIGNFIFLGIMGIFVLALGTIPEKVAIWILVERSIWDVIWLCVAFVGFRYTLFNPIYNSCYNISRGSSYKRSIFFLGDTKRFDNFMVWLLKFSWFGKKFKPPIGMFLFWTGLFTFIMAEVLLVWRLTDINPF